MLDGQLVAGTNFKDQLGRVRLEQATKRIGAQHSIAALVFHINYYIAGVLDVLAGGELVIRDKFSFDMSPVETEGDWQELRAQLLANSETFATLVEQLSDEQLDETFVDPKYGSYRRNLNAMFEHCYYHLGQVSLLRKLSAD